MARRGRGRRRRRTDAPNTKKPDSNMRREEGVIEEALPAMDFRIRLDNGDMVLAKPAGKMRLYRIRVVPGDRVQVDVSEDGQRGRIVRRL